MPGSFKDKTSYTLHELLDDDAFIRLVKTRNRIPQAMETWNDLLQAHPGQRALLLQAADIIDLVNGTGIIKNNESRQRVWIGINEELKQVKKYGLGTWTKVAAALILLFSIAFVTRWYLYDSYNRVTWQTGIKESRKIKLPDNSIITMGNNSTLIYGKTWNKDAPREVWLTGEAHFEVAHINKNPNQIQTGERFVVHINDKMDVEVLGTVFNVVKKQGKLAVVLESGAVNVILNTSGYANLYLQPGEQAELDENHSHLTRMKTIESRLQGNPAQQSIELDNTSVAEIIRMIEKTYHKKIETTDSSLLSRRIDGSFPLFNEKDVWFTLSNILDIDIEIRNDGVLLLRPKKN